MVRNSPWARVLPPLGIILGVLLVAAVGSVYLARPGGGADASVARIVALTQAASAAMSDAYAGDTESLASLGQLQADLQRARSQAPPGLGSLASLDENLAAIAGASVELAAFRDQRERVLMLAPGLLVTTGDLMSALPPGQLDGNRAVLERLETAVQRIDIGTRMLALPGADIEAAVGSLSDAQDFLSQLSRGLSGGDPGLGLTSVSGQVAANELESAMTLFDGATTAIGTLISMTGRMSGIAATVREFEAGADRLYQDFREPSSLELLGLSVDERLSLYLMLGALFILACMMFAYYQARDYRRAAELQAEQNERNQQAILRLLDELSSLADGDLTVQATVTEDITGAIADSINYAIDALRELVATVNESSILVDAAAKQTESTSSQLVRSAETQAKQAAAASDSISKMVASVEEISGNSERCADVARYAVDIAHKGGDAVRRTIEGMNTIRETIQDTSKRIKRLGESSQEIGNIVELIEEIAEQTNILALNASIEASRAGESSRGFAVVADEVQKLAERSTAATRKIEVLVSTIQSDTNEAVVSMERSTTDVVGGALLAENAGAALEEIEQVSHQIASLVQNISSTARGQSQVSTAINKNMQVLRHISSRNSESSNATSAAIHKLSALATQLRRTVKGFTLPDELGSTGILSQEQVAESLRTESQPAPAAPAAAVQQKLKSG